MEIILIEIINTIALMILLLLSSSFIIFMIACFLDELNIIDLDKFCK